MMWIWLGCFVLCSSRFGSLYFTFLLKNFRQYFLHTQMRIICFVSTFFVAWCWELLSVGFSTDVCTQKPPFSLSLQLTRLLVWFVLLCTNEMPFCFSFVLFDAKQIAVFTFKNTNVSKMSSSRKHCWIWTKFYELYFNIDFGDIVTFYR